MMMILVKTMTDDSVGHEKPQKKDDIDNSCDSDSDTLIKLDNNNTL